MSATENLLDDPLVDKQCLALLGMKDHPLAHMRLGNATRKEVMAAAKLHERAAEKAADKAADLQKEALLDARKALRNK